MEPSDLTIFDGEGDGQEIIITQGRSNLGETLQDATLRLVRDSSLPNARLFTEANPPGNVEMPEEFKDTRLGQCKVVVVVADGNYPNHRLLVWVEPTQIHLPGTVSFTT